jgi:hypothetical protein
MAERYDDANDDQIEGTKGKVPNTFGGKTSDDGDIDQNNMGVGINTDVAMKTLLQNKALYNRDKQVETMYGQMSEPIMEPPGAMPLE